MKQHDIFIVFPNQLYKDLRKYQNVYLVEEPLFFYDADKRPLAYHKAKLAYMVTCMKTYTLHTQTTYVPYKDIAQLYNSIKGKSIVMHDPMDHDVIAKYRDICADVTILPSKSFVMTQQDLQEFHQPGKNALHSRFFDFVKRKLNVLVTQPSTDKENQHPMPKKDFVPPSTPRYHSKHHNHAIEYVESLWPSNPGTYDGLTLWPTTHKQALAHLKTFLKERFHNFGTYQDAVHPDHPFLYHSTISPALNIGLLTPQQVLKEALAYASKHNIPMNSLEGFVRQLIGWREYMRYLYVFHHSSYISHPIPKAKSNRIRDWNAWHTGNTRFPIINAEIKKCLSISGGYAHHIIRLMVFLNIFLLLRIHPEDIYKWFMEVCAIDAYDWVMKPNIYCMGYFYPKAMSRQYISTSNYVVKMSSSSYKRDPEWDKLFHKYVTDFRPPAYLRNLKT